MSGYINTLVFGVYPYVCLTVLALGSIIRYDREPYTWRSGSSQLLRRRQLVIGSNFFHIGILVIFLGHLGGLLTPIAVFDALGISHGAKQIMAIVIGGLAGVRLPHRRDNAAASPAGRSTHTPYVELRRHRHPGPALCATRSSGY